MKTQDVLKLLAELQDREESVQLQKLAGTTRINDCSEPLWEMTGYSKQIERCPIDKPYPNIRDLGYPVWRCRVGMKYQTWHYGKSIIEVITKALA